jgi:hypothetical protein
MTGGFRFYTWTGPLNRPKPVAEAFHRLGAGQDSTAGGGVFSPLGGVNGMSRMARSGVQVVDYRAEPSRCQAHLFLETLDEAEYFVRALHNTIGTHQRIRLRDRSEEIDVLVLDIIAAAPRSGRGCCSVLQEIILVLEALN